MENFFKKIKELHSGDKEQLDIIFSNKDRIIVEAPAGFGKTQTMVSKIACLIITNTIPNPKKILALTFSVNAAYKIRKDIAEKLPLILENALVSPTEIKNKVFTTNYHGFCRRVLKLYGYLLHPNLKNLDILNTIDDSNPEDLRNLNIVLNSDTATEISTFNDSIKKNDINYLKNNLNFYLKYIKELFLVKDFITYNSILLLTLDLFRRYPQVLDFYQNYFPVIIIDEFQDTNVLSWSIICKLIKDETKLIFMGDSLQRIYGFIGAIPDLIIKAEKKFQMYKIELKTNYRFKDKKSLLLIDKNIRENARNPHNPAINESVEINLYGWKNQNEESEFIVDLISNINKSDPISKIAILVKQRGKNIDRILNEFGSKINYFYALYSDEDKEYLDFHKKVLNIFLDIIISEDTRLNKSICNRFLKKCQEFYYEKKSNINTSLLKLLYIFIEKIFSDFNFLSIEEKIEFIKDTLESRSLKQYLMYTDTNTIVSTVHGAKGLEWDYVILPDMEQFLFPSYLGLCGVCDFKNNCKILWNYIKTNSNFEKIFLDELSVFYVASTRAKKDIFYSYSLIQIKKENEVRTINSSCFLNLKGLTSQNIKN